MATVDPTVNYSWNLPTDLGSLDIWGTELNTAIGDFGEVILSIDEVLASIQTALDAILVTILDLEQRVVGLQSGRQFARYCRLTKPDALDTNNVLNTPFAINWPVATFDVGGPFHNVGADPNRLTVPTDGAGIYNISGQIIVPLHAGGGGASGNDDRIGWELSIYKNDGADPVARTRYPGLNDGSDSSFQIIGPGALQVQCIDEAVAGDFYELRLSQQDNASGKNLTAIWRAISDHFEIVQYHSPSTPVLADMQWGNPMIEGRWSRLDGWRSSGSEGTSGVFDDGKIAYRPVMVHRTVVIDQLAFGIFSSTDGENNVRLGIYSSNALTGIPQTLLSQTPDIELNVETSKTVFSAALLSDVTLQPNRLYWFAFAQYNVSGSNDVSPFAYDTNLLGSYLGWDTATLALQDEDQATGILSTPSPLLAGALPDIADLTALVWFTGKTPSVAAHLNSIT